LTVLATAFAGLSSSEMTYAMYYRSVAAQHQSKAGDQWSFFQAKRTRGTTMESSAELLQSLGHPGAFEPADIDAVISKMIQSLEKSAANDEQARTAATKVSTVRSQLASLLGSDQTKNALSYLTGPTLPKIEAATGQTDGAADAIKEVVDAIRQRKPESEISPLIAKLRDNQIDDAVHKAEEAAAAFDKACAPVTETARQIRANFDNLAAALGPLRKPAAEDAPPSPAVAAFDRLDNSFRAVVFAFDARRYREEAVWNRKVAEIIEVRVRRAGIESDRHRDRSKQFFYSMLVAQGGVTIASLALARQHRSLLWVVAAIAGLASLAFTAWVYLTF
jgi:ribosomal protein L12E/L44/L45/RPP1/RPP2